MSGGEYKEPKIGNSASSEHDLAKLQELAENGFSAVRSAAGKDLIMFIGKTGSGKTSFIHYMSGVNFKYERVKSVKILLKPASDQDAREIERLEKEGLEIGHQKESKTLWPNTCKVMNFSTDQFHPLYYYLDTPGFFDTRGSDVRVATELTLQAAIKGGRSIQAIVVFLPLQALTDPRDTSIKELVQAVTDILKDFNSVAPAFHLLVTHVAPEELLTFKPAQVVELLQEFQAGISAQIAKISEEEANHMKNEIAVSIKRAGSQMQIPTFNEFFGPYMAQKAQNDARLNSQADSASVSMLKQIQDFLTYFEKNENKIFIVNHADSSCKKAIQKALFSSQPIYADMFRFPRSDSAERKRFISLVNKKVSNILSLWENIRDKKKEFHSVQEELAILQTVEIEQKCTVSAFMGEESKEQKLKIVLSLKEKEKGDLSLKLKTFQKKRRVAKHRIASRMASLSTSNTDELVPYGDLGPYTFPPNPSAYLLTAAGFGGAVAAFSPFFMGAPLAMVGTELTAPAILAATTTALLALSKVFPFLKTQQLEYNGPPFVERIVVMKKGKVFDHKEEPADGVYEGVFLPNPYKSSELTRMSFLVRRKHLPENIEAIERWSSQLKQSKKSKKAISKEITSLHQSIIALEKHIIQLKTETVDEESLRKGVEGILLKTAENIASEEKKLSLIKSEMEELHQCLISSSSSARFLHDVFKLAMYTGLSEEFEAAYAQFESYLSSLPTNFLTGSNTSSNSASISSKSLKAQLPTGKTIFFSEEKADGNGDCAFTVLGASRDQVADCLMSLMDNPHMRERLTLEIQQGLESGEFKQVSSKALFDERIRVTGLYDDLIREIRESFPEWKSNSNQTREEQHASLKVWLKQKDFELPEIDKMTEQRLACFQAEEEIRAYCRKEEVAKNYVKALRGCLWLGYESALLYAKSKKISLYIWGKDTLNPNQLNLINHYRCDSQGQVIHMLHTDRYTHFNLLVECSPDLIAGESQSLKKAQNITLMDEKSSNSLTVHLPAIGSTSRAPQDVPSNATTSSSGFWSKPRLSESKENWNDNDEEHEIVPRESQGAVLPADSPKSSRSGSSKKELDFSDNSENEGEEGDHDLNESDKLIGHFR